MSFRKWTSIEGKGKLEKIAGILCLSLLAFLLVATTNISCKKEAEETETEAAAQLPAGIKEFSGKVSVGVGKYLYLPAALGYDIIVQGQVESGDASTLVGKDIVIRGKVSETEPSVLVADNIDINEGGGQLRNVFTRAEEPVLNDYTDAKVRAGFQVLENLVYNKNQDWEGKGKVKIYGQLVKAAEAGGGEVNNIVLSDNKGKEIGKIIIDSFTDYALYNIKKLRLFNKFWFYINIKETVDAKIRNKTHDLFHCDVIFAGLY